MKNKGFVNIILVLAIVVLGGVLGYFVVRKEEQEVIPKNKESIDEAGPMVEEKEEVVKLPRKDVEVLKEGEKISTTKIGKIVTLFSDDKKLFEYEEELEKDNTGNYWTGLSSNTAVSSDNDKIAYISTSGLKIFNTITKTHKLIIPFTTHSSMGVFKPVFSADNRFILVSFSTKGGGSYGLVDVEAGQMEQIIQGPITDITWSNNGSTLVWTHAEGVISSSHGLWLLKLDNGRFSFEDIKKINLAQSFGKKDSNFLSVEFSQDDKRLIFTYTDKNTDQDLADYKNDIINASINIDGSEFMIL